MKIISWTSLWLNVSQNKRNARQTPWLGVKYLQSEICTSGTHIDICTSGTQSEICTIGTHSEICTIGTQSEIYSNVTELIYWRYFTPSHGACPAFRLFWLRFNHKLVHEIIFILSKVWMKSVYYCDWSRIYKI